MVTTLKKLIEVTGELSPIERLELIQVLSQSLQRDYQQLLPSPDFWHVPTIQEIIEARPVAPVSDIATLVVDFWPAEESADDVIEYICRQRHADATRY